MSFRKLFDLPDSETGAAISAVKSTRRVAAWLAALALLILCVDCSECLARQIIDEQQLDSMIFQRDGNAAGARRRLDSQLSLQLDDIDRVCKLTEAQKVKLQLAARGDIKRFFDRWEALKRNFKPLDQRQPEFQQEYQKLHQNIRPLQLALQSGLFRDDSLIHKSFHDALTEQQQASYAAMERERRLFHHRASVALAVSTLEQAVPLRDVQRQKLIDLLVNETKPAQKPGQYDYYYLMWQFSRLPDEKTKSMFDDVQRKSLGRFFDRVRSVVPTLKQTGEWPGDDEDADRAPAQPAAPKK
jgi:hypothetical protein